MSVIAVTLRLKVSSCPWFGTRRERQRERQSTDALGPVGIKKVEDRARLGPVGSIEFRRLACGEIDE